MNIHYLLLIPRLNIVKSFWEYITKYQLFGLMKGDRKGAASEGLTPLLFLKVSENTKGTLLSVIVAPRH